MAWLGKFWTNLRLPALWPAPAQDASGTSSSRTYETRRGSGLGRKARRKVLRAWQQAESNVVPRPCRNAHRLVAPRVVKEPCNLAVFVPGSLSLDVLRPRSSSPAGSFRRPCFPLRARPPLHAGIPEPDPRRLHPHEGDGRRRRERPLADRRALAEDRGAQHLGVEAVRRAGTPLGAH